MKTNIKNEENKNFNYETLIQKLRSQDSIIFKKNKLMVVLSATLLVAWVALCIYNNDYTYITTDGLLNMFIFILMTLILVYRIINLIQYKRINYANSVRDSLYLAEKRYRFWNQKTIFEFSISIILGIAFGYFLFSHKVDIWPVLKNMVVSISAPVLILSFSMSRLYTKWKNENKPLWISTKNLLKEFE